VLAGAAVGVSWIAANASWFLAGALLTGAGTGIVTVTLAGMLRREIGGTRLGMAIGLGTGLAYGICNLPPIFSGAKHVQFMVAIAAIGIGLLALQNFEQRGPVEQAAGPDYERSGRIRWIAIFLALVATDSLVFYFVQHSPELKHGTWTGHARLWLVAGAHLVAAVVAGLALDRRRVSATLIVATVMLATASVLLSQGIANAAVGALYAAAVSVYSTALVFYPARRGEPGLAAALYSVAGWAGSGLGIVIASHLKGIPVWLPLVMGGLVVALLATRVRK
jgi:cytochrome c oxidase cbb3-type subunit 2